MGEGSARGLSRRSVMLFSVLLTTTVARNDIVPPPPTQRPWAVVTGASGGIGACIAREAADRGFNVLLAARRKDRLLTLAAELENTGAETLVVPCDLGQRKGVDTLAQATESVDVRLCILNAGLCRQGELAEQSSAHIDEMLDLNVAGQTSLLAHFASTLPIHRGSRGGRRRRAILVVASSAGAAPGVPGVASASTSGRTRPLAAAC